MQAAIIKNCLLSFEWRKQVGAQMPVPNSEAGAEGAVKKVKKKAK